MNISDLQYIESVDASEVQGAGGKHKKNKGKKSKGYFKKSKATADLNLDIEALGDVVDASADVEIFTDSTPSYSVSSISIDASSSSKSYTYYSHH